MGVSDRKKGVRQRVGPGQYASTAARAVNLISLTHRHVAGSFRHWQIAKRLHWLHRWFRPVVHHTHAALAATHCLLSHAAHASAAIYWQRPPSGCAVKPQGCCGCTLVGLTCCAVGTYHKSVVAPPFPFGFSSSTDGVDENKRVRVLSYETSVWVCSVTRSGHCETGRDRW